MGRRMEKSITKEDLEQARSVPDYSTTQPYRLGQAYKEFGERLMDERTDLRDLVIIAHRLGVKLHVEFVDIKEEVEVTRR